MTTAARVLSSEKKKKKKVKFIKKIMIFHY